MDYTEVYCILLMKSTIIIFLIPKIDNILLIGDITELHKYSLNLTLKSSIVK